LKYFNIPEKGAEETGNQEYSLPKCAHEL